MNTLKRLSAPTILMLVSFVLTIMLFFPNDFKSFDFFSNTVSLAYALLFTVLFSIIPLVIYGRYLFDGYYLRPFLLAMFGFLPLIIFYWLLNHF